MSEFKFACPVCGQHITADSQAAGSQLGCPTCFRKIVVPQAPASVDPKFVLSAAEAARPKSRSHIPTMPPAPVTAPPRKSRVLWGVILFFALVAGVSAALFLFRAKIFPAKPELPVVQAVTNAVPPAKPGVWSLNLTNVEFPEGIASGAIHNENFTTERAIVQGGTLTLRRGGGTTEPGLNIYFFAKQPAELSGKVIDVHTNDPIAPRVVLHWKDSGQPMTQNFTGGYALRLEFGQVNGNRLPGKIFICLPDPAQSYVAGDFNAEIRRPPQPKQPRPHRR